MFGASKSGQSIGKPDPQFNYVTALLHGDGTNGAQNNTFLDSSTNNATITRTGTPTQGSFSPYGSLWSNYFNGSTDYFVSSTSLLAYSTANKNTDVFTFEAWVYITATKTVGSTYQSQSMLAKGNVYINWGIDSSNQLLLYSYATGVHSFSSTTAISLNTWTHVASTVSGGTITHYINGVASGTGTWYGSDDTTDISTIGHAPAVSAAYLQGYISNLRVTNALVYSSAFTPSKTPLTAISGTQLLTCQSNRFIDNSTNAFVPTINGTPSVQRFNPFLPTYSQAYSTSVYGGSGYFNSATTDYLTFPGSSQFTLGTNDFTIECWVYLNDITARKYIYGPGSDTASHYAGFGLEIWNQQVCMWASSDGTSWNMLECDTSSNRGNIYIPQNTWTHIAVVRTGGNTFKNYVNGVLDRTFTNSGSIANNTSQILNIGRAAYLSGNFYFNGYISNFRVVNGTAVYTSSFTPPTTPLTAITNTKVLTLTTNAGIYDNAMMNDLITVGSAQISTSVKKYGTGSLSFNGTTDYLILPKNNAILDPLSGNFTYECWLYLSSTQRGSIIGSGSGSNVFTVWVDYNSSSSGKLGMWASSNGSSWNMINSDSGGNGIGTTVLSTGVWYHVAYTRSGNTFRLFLNGNLEVSVTVSGTIASSNSSWEIGRQGTYGYYLNGYIDDFRITQGYARYTSNFTPPTAALPNYGS